jgi:hypothetical protein
LAFWSILFFCGILSCCPYKHVHCGIAAAYRVRQGGHGKAVTDIGGPALGARRVNRAPLFTSSVACFGFSCPFWLIFWWVLFCDAVLCCVVPRWFGGGLMPKRGQASSAVRIVSRGVDTLVVNVFWLDERGRPAKCDLDEDLARRLGGWKASAQMLHKPYVTSLVCNGKALSMRPGGGGKGQWTWILETRDFVLSISNGHWNGLAAVRFSSEYLWSCPDLLAAVRPVHAFLCGLFQHDLFLQVSLVDLCVDVAGWSGIGRLDRNRDFVTHVRKRRDRLQSEGGWTDGYSNGLSTTGFDFGRNRRGSSPLSCRIYEKTLEVSQSGKLWFLDLWRHNGWSEAVGKVWRVEFSFKREVLHELFLDDVLHGIEDVYDLPQRLPLLWAYAAGQVGGGPDEVPDGWLRCVLAPSGSDTNRSRWPTHPAWQVIQGAFQMDCARPVRFGRIVRKRWEDRNIEKGIEAVMGYLSSLAAWAGDDLAGEGIDLSLVLHWFYERGEAYLKRTKRDFSEEVQEKRLRMGLTAPDEPVVSAGD